MPRRLTRRLTHEQQLRQALQLLDPPANEHPRWRKRVESALTQVDGAVAIGRVGSAQAQRAWKRHRDALFQARTTRKELVGWCRSYATDPAWGCRPLELDRWIDLCDYFIGTAKLMAKAFPPKRVASRSAHAVGYAEQLLRKRGLSLSRSRKGRWAKLAGVLLGDGSFPHLPPSKGGPR